MRRHPRPVYPCCHQRLPKHTEHCLVRSRMTPMGRGAGAHNGRDLAQLASSLARYQTTRSAQSAAPAAARLCTTRLGTVLTDDRRGCILCKLIDKRDNFQIYILQNARERARNATRCRPMYVPTPALGAVPLACPHETCARAAADAAAAAHQGSSTHQSRKGSSPASAMRHIAASPAVPPSTARRA